MTVQIVQISDTHLSEGIPHFVSNFDRIAESIREVRPTMIINTGDISLDGADSEADLIFSKELHAGLGIDCYMLPGNHDVGDHLDVARRQPINIERLKRYRRIIGADYWSIDIPGWRLLGLNALTLGSDEVDDGSQQNAIRTAVADIGGRMLAIFLHKPLADETYAEKLTSNRFISPHPRETLLACLGAVKPKLVLCGHIHQYRDTMISGIRHIWAPATSFIIGDPWQPGYGAKALGYLLHRFNADGSYHHRLMTVRGLVHNDLVNYPHVYGDVRDLGPGNA